MNIMLDLETLGTQPGSIILSIGAQGFDLVAGTCQKEHSFYRVINVASSEEYGLTCDPSTGLWWARQPRGAQSVLDQAHDASRSEPLIDVLREFARWARRCLDDRPVLMWGNGSDFDNALLVAAYRRTGVERPWGSYDNRCYRTLKSLKPELKIDRFRVGTHHHALDDARSQALHALMIFYELGLGTVREDTALVEASPSSTEPGA